MANKTTVNGQAPTATDEVVTVASTSSSSGLSPVPNSQAVTSASEAKKRARESNGATTSKAVKKPKAAGQVEDGQEVEAVKGVYCHQCRRKCSDYLRCTKLRKKAGQPEDTACNLAFCQSDLNRKYDTSVDAVKAGTSQPIGEGSHDASKEYRWTCPHCLDTCEASQCRRKKGLEPLGISLAQDRGESTDARPSPKNIGTSKQNGTKPNGEVSKAKAHPKSANGTTIGSSPSLSPPPKAKPVAHNGPRPLSATKAARPSHVFSLASDSELSEMDAEGDSRVNVTASKVKKATKPRASGTKSQSTSATTSKSKVAGKGNVQAEKTKVKGKAKAGVGAEKGKTVTDAKEKVKKPRPGPEKKPEVPVDPPKFERVDTRLGREEVEQRIMLREYLVRFRAVLSVPDRSLPPLDDFDRPMTEASVRSFAGAMLDLIREELEKDNQDPEVIEIVEQYREELRYFADLARFANAFKYLTGPLALKLPSAVIPPARGTANAQAIRALLDLDDDTSPPAWADVGPSRRTAASRLPQPEEVVRMLLALAERTLSTPAIRLDLAWEAPENEARRVHLRAHKKENERWEVRKKKLAEARVLCKSAAATKANKEEVGLQVHELTTSIKLNDDSQTANETNEHSLQLALANVNLRATLGQRALRHEPLGVDLDGRTYYCLHIRPIDEDARPPLAWASGLLVWGIGVPPKPDAVIYEDDPPMIVERWCHFGRSSEVRTLVKWIEYRTRKEVEAARPAKTVKAAAAATATSTATPNGKSAKGTPNGQATPSALATPKSKQQTLNFTPTPSKKRTLEVVIPVQLRMDSQEDDDASSISALSSISSEKEDLLVHLAPEGFQPSWQMIEEEGKELARRLAEVAEWLEVLEWKGMGEV